MGLPGRGGAQPQEKCISISGRKGARHCTQSVPSAHLFDPLQNAAAEKVEPTVSLQDDGGCDGRHDRRKSEQARRRTHEVKQTLWQGG